MTPPPRRRTVKKSNELSITITIDTEVWPGWTMEFSRLMKVLIENGYEDQVRQLAAQFVAEAKRRKLPIVKELGL